jgi:ATP-dependent protease HslVU (ClpYQ) peptidase subunit
MTVILGIQKTDNHAIMLGDSRTVAGERPYQHVNQPKIVDRLGYLIGAAGGGASTDFVTRQWDIPPYRGNVTPYEHMVTVFVPTLRAALADVAPAKEGEHDLFMLVAVRGQLFLIENDLTVLQDERGVYAIGSGGSLALGAYAAGATPMEAMEIAVEYDVYCGHPIGQYEQRWIDDRHPNGSTVVAFNRSK